MCNVSSQNGVWCVFYRPESIFKGPIFDPKVTFDFKPGTILSVDKTNLIANFGQKLSRDRCVFYRPVRILLKMLESQKPKKLLT